VPAEKIASALNPFSTEPTYYALGQDLGTWFSAGEFRVHLGLSSTT